MIGFTDWTPQGVIPAVLLPFKADFSIDERAYRKHLRDVVAVDGITPAVTVNGHSCEVLALLGRLPPAVVRPPLVKLPAGEICRLQQAIAEAGLAAEPASALAAE
jgi:dihydrodipicolinate synthase/N-acetylneuraminate lyase